MNKVTLALQNLRQAMDDEYGMKADINVWVHTGHNNTHVTDELADRALNEIAEGTKLERGDYISSDKMSKYFTLRSYEMGADFHIVSREHAEKVKAALAAVMEIK